MSNNKEKRSEIIGKDEVSGSNPDSSSRKNPATTTVAGFSAFAILAILMNQDKIDAEAEMREKRRAGRNPARRFSQVVKKAGKLLRARRG